MKLDELYIENFKALRKVNMTEIASKNIIVFAGENGVGKSTLFDAINTFILVALGQHFEVKDYVTKGQNEIKGRMKFILNQGELDKYSSLIPSGINTIEVNFSGKDNEKISFDPNEASLLVKIINERTSNRTPIKIMPEKFALPSSLPMKGKKKGKKYFAGNIIYIPPHRYESPKKSLKNVDKNILKQIDQPGAKYKKSSDMVERNSLVQNYLLHLDRSAERDRSDGKRDSDDIKAYNSFLDEINDVLKGTKVLQKPKYNKDLADFEFLVKDVTTGNEMTMNELSSGEKEVLFLFAYIKIQQPNSCIILIDEPELHLHPKLQRILLNALNKIGNDNQIMLLTHSIEIVRHVKAVGGGVCEVKMANKSGKNQIKECKGRESWLNLFKVITNGLEELLLVNVVIFVEGHKFKDVGELKSDEEIYSLLFDDENLNFISTGNHLGVLKSTLDTSKAIKKGIVFKRVFGITDGDALSPDRKKTLSLQYENRMSVLKKYSIENYFLDYKVLGVFLELDEDDYIQKLVDVCDERFSKVAEKIKKSRISRSENVWTTNLTSIKSELTKAIRAKNFDIVPGKEVLALFLNRFGTGSKKNYDQASKEALINLLKSNLPDDLKEMKKIFIDSI